MSSLLGVIAAHYLAQIPPSVSVAGPRRMGKPATTTFTTTSATAALPQTPTAGNVLIAMVACGGASTTPTVSTPTGWTAGPSTFATSGLVTRLGLFLFWKQAAGGDAAPAFTFSASTTGYVIIEEWTGLAASPFGANGAGVSQATTGSNLTLTDAITTSTVNEWIWTGFTATNSGVTAGPAWTLPELSLAPLRLEAGITGIQSARAAGVYPTAGAQAPKATYNASGSMRAGIASMSFKTAAGNRVQVVESAYTEYTAATTSWTATLAATPDPADILICALLHSDTIGSASISGCGATWTPVEVHDDAGHYSMHVWIGTNPTSAGTVTATSGTARQGKLRVLRVSGNSPGVVTSYSNTLGVTAATGPTVTAGAGQLVVALMGAGAADATLVTFSATTPAIQNWSVDPELSGSTGSGTSRNAWTAPASSTSHSVSGTVAVGSADWPICMLTIG